MHEVGKRSWEDERDPEHVSVREVQTTIESLNGPSSLETEQEKMILHWSASFARKVSWQRKHHSKSIELWFAGLAACITLLVGLFKWIIRRKLPKRAAALVEERYGHGGAWGALAKIILALLASQSALFLTSSNRCRRKKQRSRKTQSPRRSATSWQSLRRRFNDCPLNVIKEDLLIIITIIIKLLRECVKWDWYALCRKVFAMWPWTIMRSNAWTKVLRQ